MMGKMVLWRVFLKFAPIFKKYSKMERGFDDFLMSPPRHPSSPVGGMEDPADLTLV